MLQVLEFKGFITTAENGTGYVLTNKLFALAMAQAPVRSLVETALPIMRKLVAGHRPVLPHRGGLGRSDRRDHAHRTARRPRVSRCASVTGAKSRAPLRAWCCSPTRTRKCAAPGSSAAASRVKPPTASSSAPTSCARAAITKRRRDFVRGIVDLSAPILRGDTAVAALTMSLRAQQSAADGNAAGRGIRARRGATDIQPKSCTGTFHDDATRARRHSSRRDSSAPRSSSSRCSSFWGMSNSLNDVLIPQFRKTFLLGDFASSFVQFATFIGYFVFAIPASLFMRRFGYRAAVVMGLVLFGTGALLFYPAAQFGEYHCFLGALFVVASGLSFLETSANPHDRRHGPAGERRPAPELRADLQSARHDRRRVHRQGADPLRSSLHARADPARWSRPRSAAWRAAELAAVKLPYLGIACVVLLWALLVAIAKFPPLARRVEPRTPMPPQAASRPRGIPALLAGRARAVRLRRRAGGRVELPDPLHAAQFSGHRSRKMRCELAADHARACSSPGASSARC